MTQCSGRHRARRAAALSVAAALGLSCATAHSDKCFSFAFGKDAVAACYEMPPAPEGTRTTQTDVDGVNNVIAADIPATHTKVTEPAAASTAQLVQQSKGSAISEAASGVLKLAFTTVWSFVKLMWSGT